MRAAGSLQTVLEQLQAFKRKFYLNLLVKGALLATGLVLSSFLLITLLEYYFYFQPEVRAFLLFSFLSISAFAVVRWLWTPLLALANLKKLLSDEQAARQVAQYFPEIQDRLLNLLQLKNVALTNELVAASVEQRSEELATYQFPERIKLTQNKSYFKYLLLPLVLVLVLAFIYPTLFVQGTERIINFKTHYSPEAPFKFQIENELLQAFKGEDFQLKVSIEGNSVPEEVALVLDGREIPLKREKGNTYVHEFQKVQESVDFQLTGAGFYSKTNHLRVVARPALRQLRAELKYPAYLRKPAETVTNTGDFTVPEGTQVTWHLAAENADSLWLQFEAPAQKVKAQLQDEEYVVNKTFMQSQRYSMHLRNRYSSNKEQISYQITVIPDRAPEITLEQFRDSVMYSYLVVGGTISDDYGFSRLALHYRVLKGNNGSTGYKTVSIPFNGSLPTQSYFHQLNLKQFNLQPGDKLEYFVQVADNDQVPQPKSARTSTFTFKYPDPAELQKSIEQTSQQVQSQMKSSLNKAEELKKSLEQNEEKTKLKRELSYQDKKALQELAEKKKALQEDLEALKKMNEQLNQQQDQFSPKNEKLAEKRDQLQKMMDQLLDEETKKLYQELEKLLQQKQPDPAQIQPLLDKLNNKEENLQKELDRLLEMFKQLQVEQKLDNAMQKLEDMAKKQEDLSNKTANQKNKADQNLQQEQKNLQEQFKQMQEDLKEAEKLNEQLEHPEDMPETEQLQEQIEQEQEGAQESLQKGQNQKASQQQKSAAQKMQKMSQQMQSQEASADMQQMQQNLDHLRDILENLVTLSFGQEKLMKDFRNVQQSDPRFISMAQQQLKLSDDAKIIEDSLLSLAKRVMQIQSFVTREVGAMEEEMRKSSESIKDRNLGKTGTHQQLAMTSMNNLALMLSDVQKQMQQAMMAAQQSGPGKKKGKGKNGKGQSMMGQMQQQLNEQIQQLQKSGQSGKALSEQLAKLAAQQEMLRNAMKELAPPSTAPGSKEAGENLSNLGKLMEQTETDLVNKRLTEQTMMRQKEILTRLLQAEKAANERDLDEKREANTAKELPARIPPSLQKYQERQKQQTESLRQNLPALTPYYKKQVDAYFKQLGY
ncbi:DUF4175 family protein [Rufibacter quisquiliarum]|uniref:DUF4175 family protein n=1 Tax=Rufibacter quisquiliarum TaxID=1549639 RepID=A0A839GAI9_9BACT|nr:DUF4175 family protein [Rufibacter quisquiliarum]MBA9075942.1 hypothetical protein [Rufibacter quisquiliarum]